MADLCLAPRFFEKGVEEFRTSSMGVIDRGLLVRSSSKRPR